VVEDGLVRPPADDAEIVTAARDRLLAEEWDLAVVVTDLPLSVDRRTVVAHASPVHGVAVLSLPALGAVARRRRALQTTVGLVRTLLGDDTDGEGDPAALRRRVRELATDPADTAEGVRSTARVLAGDPRLLVGTVRANRPWRLTIQLSRALSAAVAAGVFALVTAGIWRCSTCHHRDRGDRGADPLRRAVRPRPGRVAAAGARGVVRRGPRAPARIGDYLEPAWLTSSLATVGGALGAGLESDEAVREAAYTHRPDAAG
jgi:hypothetical protein